MCRSFCLISWIFSSSCQSTNEIRTENQVNMISSIALKCQKYCRWQTRKIYDGLKFVRLAKSKKKMVGYNLFSFWVQGCEERGKQSNPVPNLVRFVNWYLCAIQNKLPINCLFPIQEPGPTIAQNVHNGVKQPRKCSQKLITIWDVTCYSFVLPFKILVRDVFCCCLVSSVGRVLVCWARDHRFKPWPNQPLGP